MKKHLKAIIGILVAIVAFIYFSRLTPETKFAEYELISVTDGDTLRVKDAEGEYTVRLIGIDAPEKGECFYEEATKSLESLVSNKALILQLDPTQDEKDVYGRLLRYVYVNGELVNEILVRNGFAREYTFIKPYMQNETFKKSESTAKFASMGLWSPNTCNGKK